ncbi:HlyD family secretion protein [Sediminitomix flava]|uniref:Multidrug resistance efflux pump n=1 Tax=Sediminitomix flava TaxID=379075 RepID=A0A315Z0J6_SEDFL|nr:HlyD family efflux transporter periplasmic adaptor subunit [Sediminitomix flava]PWJ36072.1 multidrug resistance efflux pump [Sediminitomix flava]
MLKISSKQSADRNLYDERLNTIEALHTPKNARALARWLLGIFLSFFIVLFLPWQQNIRAKGELTALSPSDRPQVIPSPIDGQISAWHVREGQYVDSGQVLITISEIKEKYIDPELLKRLEEQMTAKEEVIEAKFNKVKAYEKQLKAMKNGLEFKLNQNTNKIAQSRLKISSDSIDWLAAQVDLKNFDRQYKANQALYDSGLIPLVKLESARSKFQSSKAKELSQENKFNMSKAELQNALISRNSIQADAFGKIAKTESELSATLGEIAESQGQLSDYRNKYRNIEIRTGMRTIKAPQDGYVVKALSSGIGENVKVGKSLMSLMPKDPQLAVAMEVKAMDVPLLDIGRHARLQFDGWPAIQFSGWPSVSVGTFGGKVEVIDYVSGKDGKYRVLITPDLRNKRDDQWPEQLRVGSGVYGWVLLDEVPVWYELWRQINGFPPSLKNKEEAEAAEKK